MRGKEAGSSGQGLARKGLGFQGKELRFIYYLMKAPEQGNEIIVENYTSKCVLL